MYLLNAKVTLFENDNENNACSIWFKHKAFSLDGNFSASITALCVNLIADTHQVS